MQDLSREVDRYLTLLRNKMRDQGFSQLEADGPPGHRALRPHNGHEVVDDAVMEEARGPFRATDQSAGAGGGGGKPQDAVEPEIKRAPAPPARELFAAGETWS